MTGRIRVTTLAPAIVAIRTQPVATVLRRAIAAFTPASQVPNSATLATLTPQVAKLGTRIIVCPALTPARPLTVATAIAAIMNSVTTDRAGSNVSHVPVGKSV